MIHFNLLPPFSETNYVGSSYKPSASIEGVAQQLQTVAKSEPHYDGVKVDVLRENSALYHHDKIDGVAIASEKLADSVGKYKATELHKEVTKRVIAQRKTRVTN